MSDAHAALTTRRSINSAIATIFGFAAISAVKHGVDTVDPEVIKLVSHAVQEKLKGYLERLNIASEHRAEPPAFKADAARFEQTTDPRAQLRFVEELDKLERKRHEEHEREMLLRVAKSRSKMEDPEQLKLKQRAKEVVRPFIPS